jgi:hypothetical protein
MHVCPEFTNHPNIALFDAQSMSHPSSTIIGDFPPSSKMQGVRFLAAA